MLQLVSYFVFRIIFIRTRLTKLTINNNETYPTICFKILFQSAFTISSPTQPKWRLRFSHLKFFPFEIRNQITVTFLSVRETVKNGVLLPAFPLSCQVKHSKKSRVQIPFFEKSAEMQLLNSNIPQNTQTTKYSSKKAQDLLNLVLFCCVAFSYYKDGGGGRARTYDLYHVKVAL